MKSTRFYDQHAEALCEQYCAIAADDVHGKWMVKHLPEKPGFACDIGAGSGRDANGDNVVDVNDVSYVLFRLGGPAPDGDANGDGVVDVNDISYVLFRLGNGC